jgi:general stress protein YciG
MANQNKKSDSPTNRGLAVADKETKERVAHKGGVAVSRNPEHMAEIGRKGGVAVSQNRVHMAEIGRKGGVAVSRNPEHMAEIGRKGGVASHGGVNERANKGNEDRGTAYLSEEEDKHLESKGGQQ